MSIFVDQIGYKPEISKIAVVVTDNKDRVYYLINCENNKKEAEFSAENFVFDKSGGEETGRIDFSAFKKTGTYYIQAEDGETSDRFTISDNVYADVQKGMTKALYFQRCGCALEEKYAGIYKHAACHTGRAVLLEDYLKHKASPMTYFMRGGWHDAGDFGRYSTPAAVTLGHLLYAFELFPDSFGYDLNIPESGNGIPDVLNECRYELDWLMGMQTSDGGVYHKLTAFMHAEFIMPEDDKDQFILYPVSSIAVADFVAAMALASRVYKPYDIDFSERALAAARLSFEWLKNHDYVGFTNPKGSNTGEYGDDTDADERMWAAAEMLRTDRDGDANAYRGMLSKYVLSDIPKTDFGWTDVSGFALMCILTDQNHSAGEVLERAMYNALISECDRLLEIRRNSGYSLAMLPEDFVWGSNMVVTNRGILFVLASMLAKDKNSEYEAAAADMLHYLFGRNALNRSYVTGYGDHAFKNPHNRTTASDNIDAPIPGLVSGGPYRTPSDACAIKMIPKGTAPMKCHADAEESYSTNEITIYWNSSAIFVTAYFNSMEFELM